MSARRPARLRAGLAGLAARLAAVPILVYRYGISPMIGPRCRFHPTCSAYALEALDRYGPVRGLWLTLRRLARCHPWHPGGVDPLPEDASASPRYLGRAWRGKSVPCSCDPSASPRPERGDEVASPHRS